MNKQEQEDLSTVDHQLRILTSEARANHDPVTQAVTLQGIALVQIAFLLHKLLDKVDDILDEVGSRT